VNNTIVILNPAAGNGQATQEQERIQSIVGNCPVRVTSHCAEAEALARRAAEEGFEKVVAAGGDGTVNEVINGIAGSSVALGLLPIGTVNVFAMELGLPSRNLELCWDIIQSNNVRLVDLPSANGRFFVQLAGVGLDAQVVKETSQAFKRSFGPLSYLISAAQIAVRQPPKLFIGSESTSVDEASFVLFKRLGYLEIIKYLQDVVFRSDIRSPDIEYFQTKHLRVTSAQDVPLELDGELAGNCPVDFRIQEKALQVLALQPS